MPWYPRRVKTAYDRYAGWEITANALGQICSEGGVIYLVTFHCPRVPWLPRIGDGRGDLRLYCCDWSPNLVGAADKNLVLGRCRGSWTGPNPLDSIYAVVQPFLSRRRLAGIWSSRLFACVWAYVVGGQSSPISQRLNTGCALCGRSETRAMWRLSIISEEERYGQEACNVPDSSRRDSARRIHAPSAYQYKWAGACPSCPGHAHQHDCERDAGHHRRYRAFG